MRIPHLIDLNVLKVYDCSNTSLSSSFESDDAKRYIARTFKWSDNFVPPLTTLSLHVVANDIQKIPLLHNLPSKFHEEAINLISTDIVLEIAIPYIESEFYWKRRYTTHFEPEPKYIHLGWTWKCLYVERHVSKLLEEAEPQYHTEDSLIPFLKLCSPYIHNLNLTQLKEWKHPKTLLPEEKLSPPLIMHINFTSFLPILTNLVKLEICFGVKKVGINYSPHMFKVSKDDCSKLGEAIKKSKHLKVLKIHNSEVEYLHIKALIQKIYKCNSLVELDLSYCKIGDKGALCVAMLIHEQQHLKCLTLIDNKIGEKGAVGIAWALHLPETCHLRKLNLAMNPIQDKGSVALLHVLLKGAFPKEVSIAHCQISELGTACIPPMIVSNTSLRKLDVSGNEFNQTSAVKLVEAMNKNETLCYLDLRATEISEDIQLQIKTFLQRNIDNANIHNFGFNEELLTV